MIREFCPCGRPLHYRSAQVQAQVERLIQSLGQETTVTCDGNSYRVPRHYIALHGLLAADLERLAAAGIARREERAL